MPNDHHHRLVTDCNAPERKRQASARVLPRPWRARMGRCEGAPSGREPFARRRVALPPVDEHRRGAPGAAMIEENRLVESGEPGALPVPLRIRRLRPHPVVTGGDGEPEPVEHLRHPGCATAVHAEHDHAAAGVARWTIRQWRGHATGCYFALPAATASREGSSERTLAGLTR